MKNLRRFSLSLAILLLFSGVSMALPGAVHGQSGGNDTSSAGGQELAQQFKEMAKTRLDTLRAAHQEQSQQHRQQACEARKANLTRRESNAVRFAKNHKAVFDKIYQRVQDFYTAKQLNVSNYDTLKSAVDSASTDAQTSISALQALDASTIDCTSTTVADSVSAFQSAVKDSRDKLKAYRSSLVDLIKALKGASTGTNATSGSDNSTDTTNGTGQ
jgi:uncharacterized protein YukE